MKNYMVYVTDGSGMDINERFYLVETNDIWKAFVEIFKLENKDIMDEENFNEAVDYMIKNPSDVIKVKNYFSCRLSDDCNADFYPLNSIKKLMVE